MTHDLFDEKASFHFKKRAWAKNHDGDFLRKLIAEDLNDRLLDIRRHFQSSLDLGGQSFKPDFENIAAIFPPDQEQTKARTISYQDMALTENHYDLIISNLLLHSLNDPVGVLIQANRALKPDGFFLASVIGGDSLKELRHVLTQAEADLTGKVHPRIIPFADVRDWGNLLSRAGFALPVADMQKLTLTYDHPLKLLQDLKAMGESNHLKTRSKYFLRRDILQQACQLYQEKYTQEDGRITASFDIIFISGWHPHESQQKPLKPGSGQTSLEHVFTKPSKT